MINKRSVKSKKSNLILYITPLLLSVFGLLISIILEHTKYIFIGLFFVGPSIMVLFLSNHINALWVGYVLLSVFTFLYYLLVTYLLIKFKKSIAVVLIIITSVLVLNLASVLVISKLLIRF
jgi:hypothetical protein